MLNNAVCNKSTINHIQGFLQCCSHAATMLSECCNHLTITHQTVVDMDTDFYNAADTMSQWCLYAAYIAIVFPFRISDTMQLKLVMYTLGLVVLSTPDNIYSCSQLCSFSVVLLFIHQCPLKFTTINCKSLYINYQKHVF